jgi:hypothetical protein
MQPIMQPTIMMAIAMSLRQAMVDRLALLCFSFGASQRNGT